MKIRTKIMSFLLSMMVATPVYAMSGVESISVDGITLVPLRTVAEELNARVDYDFESGAITVQANNALAVMHPQSLVAQVNNIEKEMPVAIKMVEGRSYVSLRFFSEVVGATIGYDAGIITMHYNGEEYTFEVPQEVVDTKKPVVEVNTSTVPVVNTSTVPAIYKDQLVVKEFDKVNRRLIIENISEEQMISFEGTVVKDSKGNVICEIEKGSYYIEPNSSVNLFDWMYIGEHSSDEAREWFNNESKYIAVYNYGGIELLFEYNN